MPEECLNKAGIVITDNTPLSEILNHPNLKIARQALAEKALLRFAQAREALEKLNAKQMKPAVIMMKVYQKIFDMMQKRGWDVIEPRPKPSKLWMAAMAVRICLFGK